MYMLDVLLSLVGGLFGDGGDVGGDRKQALGAGAHHPHQLEHLKSTTAGAGKKRNWCKVDTIQYCIMLHI